ncbi:MAG: response regulator [Acidimicrobiia bacterium]
MKILIADDSPVTRAAVANLLEGDDHQVVMAEDGVEAIQRFYEEAPDLVLLDIQMPKMSGYLACRLLKEDWAVAHIPVLILTAHDTAEDRYWSEKSGADGYLTKEALGDALLQAVRAAGASRALSELSGRELPVQSLDQVDVMARLTALLDRKLFETTVVNDIVTMTARAGDLRSTIVQALTIVRRFVEYRVAGIAIPADRLLAVRSDQTVGRADLEQFRGLVTGQLDQARAPDDLVLWTDRPDMIDDLEHGEVWRSYFGMPLRARGDLFGLLALADHQPAAFPPQVVRTLRLIEYPLATVVDAAYHHQKLLEQEARLSLASLSEKGR